MVSFVLIGIGIGVKGFKVGDWWVFVVCMVDVLVEILDCVLLCGIYYYYVCLGFWDVVVGMVMDCCNFWLFRGGIGEDCGCIECVMFEFYVSG